MKPCRYDFLPNRYRICRLEPSEQPPDDDKHYDGATAAATQFFGAIAGDKGTNKIVHVCWFRLVIPECPKRGAYLQSRAGFCSRSRPGLFVCA